LKTKAVKRPPHTEQTMRRLFLCRDNHRRLSGTAEALQLV